jgi:hypothetical protein
MTDDDLREFEPLWTTELAHHALIGSGDIADPSGFSIVDLEANMALIIEDDDIYVAVVRRMMAAGVQRLTHMP